MPRTKNQALIVFLLLLAATGGVGLWVAVGFETERDQEGLQAGGTPQPGVKADLDPVIEKRDLLVPVPVVDDDFVSTVAYPLEVELKLVRSERGEAIAGVAPIGTGASAGITGSVYDPNGTGVSALIRFTAGANTGRELRCDSTGAFGAADLYPGISIVDIKVPDGHMAQREVRLVERSTQILNIGFGRPASVNGLVLDSAGQGIEGAEVSIDGHIAFTDSAGEFFLPELASGKTLAIVKKQGYAHYREVVPLPAGKTVEKEHLKFVLEPGVSLQIEVQEAIGGPGPALVYLTPGGGQRANSVRGQRTYPWHLVNPVEVHPGGTTVIEDLPAGRVHLSLFRAGALANPRQTSSTLIVGRTNHETLHLKPGPKVRGRIMLAGKPVPSCLVRLEAPNRPEATQRALLRDARVLQELILPHLPAASQEVRTDSAGRFQLTAFAEIAPTMYLTAVNREGTFGASRTVRAGDDEFDLELEELEDRRVSLTVPLSQRFQGLPVRVRVHGSPRDPLEVNPDEDLVIDGLEPGTWRLDATWHSAILMSGTQIRLQEDARSGQIRLPQGAVDGQTVEERIRAGVLQRPKPRR